MSRKLVGGPGRMAKTKDRQLALPPRIRKDSRP